jgi:hypothetical protein
MRKIGPKSTYTLSLRALNLPAITLAAAILASLAVYVLIFVRPAGLFNLQHKPGIDLWALTRADPGFRNHLVAGYVLLALCYLLGWWALRRLRGEWLWPLVLGGAALAGLILLFQYPFGASDIFDNIMHGRILGIYHANPFIQAPVNFSTDPFYLYAGWKYYPSMYGPLWELMAGGVARLAGNGFFQNVLAFKLLPAAFLAGSVAVTAVILRRAASQRALPGVWLLAWNPVVLTETIGTGHNDMAMVFFVLLAVWAISRERYSLSVAALIAGALVKFLPVLLVPAAGWLALHDLDGLRAKLRFLLMAGSISLGLIIAAYAPLWQGLRTLGLSTHETLYTTSLGSIVHFNLLPAVGLQAANNLVSWIAVGLTGVFAVWQALRSAAYSRTYGVEAAWLRFTRAGVNIFLFYILVTCLWFQNWYLLWPISLAVLLPGGPAQVFTLAAGFVALTKPLIVAPYLLWRLPLPVEGWREWRLTLGVLAPIWLAGLLLLWRRRWE